MIILNASWKSKYGVNLNFLTPFGVVHVATNLIARMHFWLYNKKFIGVSQLQYDNTLLLSKGIS